MKCTNTQIFLVSVGVLIWTIVIIFAWQMQQNYDFYLWVINQPLLADFGGASNQIIVYSGGLVVGLILMSTALLSKIKK